MTSRTAFLAISPRRLIPALVYTLLTVEVSLIGLDLVFHLGGYAPEDLQGWFDTASERGLGSWVSVTQTVLIAVTLWAMVAAYQAAGRPRARVAGWAVLAAAFSYLALDDGTRLHERIGAAFADTSAAASGIGAAFPSYYWQLVLGPVFVALGAFMAVFLWRELSSWTLRGAVAVAFGLLASAVALDFVDGLGPDHPANVYAALAASLDPVATEAGTGLSPYALVVHLSRAVEESLEMAGMTAFWAVFLWHLAGTLRGVSVSWGPSRTRRTVARRRVRRRAHAPVESPRRAEPAFVARPRTARARAVRAEGAASA